MLLTVQLLWGEGKLLVSRTQGPGFSYLLVSPTCPEGSQELRSKHHGQTESAKQIPLVNLKEPERKPTVLKESGEIPQLFFFPHSLMPQWGSIGARTLKEGKLTLHLKELRPQEDGQTFTALFPLSWPSVGTVIEVPGMGG